MFEMRDIICRHALQSLTVPVEAPSKTLAVGADEKHNSIPLLIFTEQHLPTATPDMLSERDMKFEDVQLNGAGASLSLLDFETQNFNIGKPYGSA